MKITKRQLRRIIREAIYDQASYNLGLSTEEGLRTPLAKLLATIAKNEPDGWTARNDDEKIQMAHLRDKGLVTYGLDPRGGYRAHVTDGGLQSLQNI
mgnify:CR=1 FL=1